MTVSHKKARLVLLLGVLFLLGLAAVMHCTMFQWDDTVADDMDLRVAAVEVPASQNGILVLMSAPEPWPLYGSPNENKLWTMAAGEDAVDLSLVENVVSRNAELLTAVDKAVAAADFKVPWPPLESRSENELQQYTSIVGRAAMTARFRAIGLAEKGRVMDALNAAMIAAQLGRRFQRAGVDMGRWGAGSGAVVAACAVMWGTVRRSDAPVPELLLYRTRLGQLEPDVAEASECLKKDYLKSAQIVRQNASAGFDAMNEVVPMNDRFDDPVSRWFFGSRYFLKPNATVRCLAEATRCLIGNLELPGARRARWGEPGFERYRMHGRFLPNSVGWYIANEFFSAENGLFLLAYDLQRLVVRATSTLIALKCYYEREKKLPDDLKALVPEFLEEVPRDPFDGESLRYSAADRILYSVGTDLQDAGGKPDSGGGRLRYGMPPSEPTFAIDF